MTMASEKFCLKWNDFSRNISGAFKELLDNEDFFDVTLACDDNQIQAHKVILAACSPFFRNILHRNPHQHPLLYMKGLKHSDLECIISFIYQGEVSVAQEELSSFLAVAQDLRIKGLTQNDPDMNGKKEIISPEPNAREMPSKSRIPGPDYAIHAKDNIQEHVPVK